MLSVDCFARLKQRVVWKFDKTLADLPSNVVIQKWLPQNDILAHPNVVAFISHGGVFGMVESVWNAVPMVLIPFFGDQHRNTKRAVRAGYGIYLPYLKIKNEFSVCQAVHELLTNKSYSDKAREVSAIFRSNLVPPMQEAMFWIEYAAKFRDASHLKSKAVSMNWFAYLLLDVWLVVAFAVASVVVLIGIVLCWCCGRCRKRSPFEKTKKE